MFDSGLLQRMADAITGMDAPQGVLLVVLPPSMMVDLAKEVDRVAVTKVTVDADGATRYEVQELREGAESPAGLLGSIGSLDGFRFIQSPRPTFEPKRQPPPRPADRMAQLRRFTGQDWRGRR